MTAKVEIYGTSFCRHCIVARELLDKKNVEYTDYKLDLTPHHRDEMIQRCGIKKVPQIFINDQHVGSDEDLLESEFNGELDRLLAAPPV